MGYLNIANDMVNNTTNLLDNVLNSKFTTYLQGNGTPMFVTYYNIDDTTSTTNNGTFTPDQALGPNSPLRFNKIENFPVYGLKDLIPSIDELEGNLYDLTIDGEVVILPNTIKPNGYDYFVCYYLDSYIIFTVTNIEFSSIKSNNYYKLSISLKDINHPEYLDCLNNQTVHNYIAKLDNIGTQDRVILESQIDIEVTQLQKVRDHLIEYYIDSFYDKRYNCLILRNELLTKDFSVYDPFLTKFIIDNNILDTPYKFIHLVNFDYRKEVDMFYNRSIYKCLETHNCSKLQKYYLEPVTFRTVDTNPFAYYGEETVFTLYLYPLDHQYVEFNGDECKHVLYGHKQLMDSIVPFDDKFAVDYDDNSDATVKTINSKLSNDELLSVIKSESYDEPDDTKNYLTKNEDTSPKPEKYIFTPKYITFIHDYIKGDMYNLISQTDLDELYSIEIINDYIDFMHIPMLIYVLNQYISFISNNKLNS